MTEAAINGMLASLDPHSTYLDPKQLNEFQTTMKGEEFGGLGLEVMQDGGLVRVVSPIDDTPAARAGLLSGDLIVKIDDTPVQGLSLKEAVDRMRGPARSSVRLTVNRGPNKDVKEFTIVREIIHVQPVRSHVESGDIGYIRITQFNQQTYDFAESRARQVQELAGIGQAEGLYPGFAQQSRAACSPNRSRSSIRSSTRAKSSRPAAGRPISINPTAPAPATTSPTASRWSYSSTAARPRRPRSYRARCRTSTARR